MSRKYRQPGYQDDEVRSDPGASSEGRARRGGPRGRGLGAPTRSSIKCSRCGEMVAQAIEAASVCPACDSDLHTCTNCRYFDTSDRYECSQPVSERISAKAKRNDCDLFGPRIVHGFDSDSTSRSDDPKAAFDALFDL